MISQRAQLLRPAPPGPAPRRVCVHACVCCECTWVPTRVSGEECGLKQSPSVHTFCHPLTPTQTALPSEAVGP